MKVLETKSLSKNFGGLQAVSNVNIVANKGELIGLIGPNGAGKTTLFNLLTGVYEASSGEINLYRDGKELNIVGKKPHTVTQLGIARTFQNIRLFKELTVLDNIKVAMNNEIKYGLISTILRLPKYYREEEKVEEKAQLLLNEVGLLAKKDEKAKNLPYGEQRKLEIARALATNPSILFLDEPAAGMNPRETKELTTLIEELRHKFDLTIVLIEHDMSLVMKICEKIYVLDYGRLIATGNPEQIKNNKRVIEAYLGED